MKDHPEMEAWITPEMEARIVAFVLGEASAFEAAELERLIDEKPELGIFKRRIEAVHGLTREAVAGKHDGWKLSPERRRKVLAVIGGSHPAGSTTIAPVTARTLSAKRVWAVAKPVLLGLAACLVVAFVVVGLFSPAGYIQKKAAPAFEGLSDVGFAAPAGSAPALSPPADADRLSRTFPQTPSLQQTTPQARTAPVPIPSSQLSASVSSEIQVFSGGWAKGSGTGTGTGVRAREFQSQTEEKSSRENVELKAKAEQRLADGRGDATGAGSMLGEAAPSRDGAAEGRSRSSQQNNAPAIGDIPIQGRLFAGAKDSSAPLDQVASLSQIAQEQTLALGAEMEAAPSEVNGIINYGSPIVLKEASDKLKQLAQKREIESDTETPASKEPFSTFSLHVSDVSFQLAQAALSNGQLPDPDTIRPEEFYNAFDYGDPAPASGEEVACRIEQAAHPFLQQRNLVRIAVQVAATGRGSGQPLRLTVLLDTSGSMEREDRVESVRAAMTVLASLLGPDDSISLIGFARQPRLIADRMPGDRAQELLKLIAQTPAQGGTNLEEALRLASETALHQLDPAAQNRIVLLTDGAANLGNADPAKLAETIGNLRQQGIAFDACGVGAQGYNDSILESLTRKGDGRYYFLNRPEDADAGFARQLAGAFRPAAENVKVQVRFNPARVGNYRLIGFEKHRLRQEDFRNDLVDAAELAAEEAANALYQVEVLPEGNGEIGDVFVRFRDATSGRMVERSWTIIYDPRTPAFDQASPAMQLAGTSAMMSEKMRGGAMTGVIDLQSLAAIASGLRGHFSRDEKVQDLATMLEQMRRLE